MNTSSVFLDGADALMAETTTLAQIYTAGRGYTQYFYRKAPKNIVDNDHLSLIVNAALMLDQGLVFNSIDGASVIEYMMQVKKAPAGAKLTVAFTP